jgi:hypothetical protein
VGRCRGRWGCDVCHSGTVRQSEFDSPDRRHALKQPLHRTMWREEDAPPHRPMGPAEEAAAPANGPREGGAAAQSTARCGVAVCGAASPSTAHGPPPLACEVGGRQVPEVCRMACHSWPALARPSLVVRPKGRGPRRRLKAPRGRPSLIRRAHREHRQRHCEQGEPEPIVKPLSLAARGRSGEAALSDVAGSLGSMRASTVAHASAVQR